MAFTLSIIIVNWNGVEFLPNCLRSIAKTAPNLQYEVIVVDNASSDGSKEWLASDSAKDIFPCGCFSFIKSDENLGFGKGNNLAMRVAKAPIYLLLNPDTMVMAGAIDRLLATINSVEGIGLVAPKLSSLDGKVHTSVRAFPNSASRILVDGLGLYRLLPRNIRGPWLLGRHWSYDERRNVPFVSGAVMMVRRAAVNEIGGFDPDIHMYGEDVDLCARLSRQGWTIIFEPDAEVLHLGGQSSAQRWGSDETNILEEKGDVRVQQKYQSRSSWRRAAVARLLILSLIMAKRFVRGEDNSALRQVFQLYSTNL